MKGTRNALGVCHVTFSSQKEYSAGNNVEQLSTGIWLVYDNCAQFRPKKIKIFFIKKINFDFAWYMMWHQMLIYAPVNCGT